MPELWQGTYDRSRLGGSPCLTGDLSGRTELFRIEEMGNLVFAVECVKQIVEENGFTNIQMKERGHLPSPRLRK